ncbi:fusarin C cluster-methyltransferase [Fusarium pseudocircinatum]|uniref:Fusarin C cluster-methyltransferase n=1 Tax=Fusarium pseudocircinatum TaxID=56676 RepID=A0A8H5KSK1_9HYPO|nr:fusarin C cluster-methyltransferase [Fusarium pseudocircinatum]
MADKSHVNNVPMQGNGAYSSHAALQHEAMLKALPLFQAAAKAISKANSARIAIVEYGSAHGNNSLEPMEAILKSISARSLELLFSDRPENDFCTLSKTVTAWADGLVGIQLLHPLFISMIPRSFYQQVIPPKSAHLGFSLAALHHLDHVPQPTEDGQDESKLLQQQAHLDLATFLKLRSQEIVTGGSLILSFVSQASAGYENYSGPVDACRNAMIQMVQQGKIPVSVAQAFRVPTYNRTLSDVKRVMDEFTQTWKVHDLFEDDVVHPAFHELKIQANPSQEASHKYAEIVIDWMMAVCSGYFTKALQVGSQRDHTKQEEESLLQDWVTTTKELFIRDHRDEEVICSFIYIRLERF